MLADTLASLYARRRFGIRPGLERVRLLLERLGNPENSFRTIHVVGTNGKGSTSTFLASILTASGQRTALFTSPHLVSFTERFRIQGLEIAPEHLEQLLAAVLEVAPDEATFFEIVTALAILCFSEEKVDVAVMEAGMGGRSDATAIMNGIMTLITPVSLDHCEYLGLTLEAISAEKAGIAKPGTPVIVGRQLPAVHQAISDCLGLTNPDLIWMEKAVSALWNSDGSLDYRGLKAHLPCVIPGIPGRYQADNAALALTAAEILDANCFGIDDKALLSGISTARLAGRMERVSDSPALVLDGAHNPAGMAALVESLASCTYRNLLLVVGVMADKDAAAIVSVVVPLAVACYCVTPGVERAMNAVELTALLTGMGVNARNCGNVGAGICAARNDAGSDDLILVCGSLFTVGEAKAWLSGTHFEGIRG